MNVVNVRTMLWLALWTVPTLYCLAQAWRGRFPFLRRERWMWSALLLFALLAAGWGIELRSGAVSESVAAGTPLGQRTMRLRVPGIVFARVEVLGDDARLLSRREFWTFVLPPSLLLAWPAFALSARRRRRTGISAA